MTMVMLQLDEPLLSGWALQTTRGRMRLGSERVGLARLACALRVVFALSCVASHGAVVSVLLHLSFVLPCVYMLLHADHHEVM